jgi:glycosyltransferase involved in cell wall biosynthesis
MTDLVSIIVPIFNRETLIGETLLSALNQTYSKIAVDYYKI